MLSLVLSLVGFVSFVAAACHYILQFVVWRFIVLVVAGVLYLVVLAARVAQLPSIPALSCFGRWLSPTADSC